MNSLVGNQLMLTRLVSVTCGPFSQVRIGAPCVLLNLEQRAGFKKRQSSRILHKPDFTELDQLPGDQYQNVYVGYYDSNRHSNPRALDRFYRLNWGGWIRPRGGRHNRLWAKNERERWWSGQHVLCNEQQCEQLERMITPKYRKKTYFVDDPYEVYEQRSLEFLPIGHSPYSYSYIKDQDK